MVSSRGEWIRLAFVVAMIAVGIAVMALWHPDRYLGFALFLAGMCCVYSAVRGLRAKQAAQHAIDPT